MSLPLNSTTAWLLGISALCVLTFIITIVLLVQNARLRRKVRRWQEIHSTADLEEVYEQTIHRVDLADEAIVNLAANLKSLELALRTKVGTPKVKRYNAFADTGSDLSFSIALLDDTQTGVVLSSIYGREESRTYGKPISGGKSSYPLTTEEIDVLTASTSERVTVSEPV